MKHKLLILAAALATQVQADNNQVQGGQILLVGDDNACGFSSIQAAVDASVNGARVRVASNKIYTENVTISDKELTVSGGYADCTAADNNITDLSRATVGGNSGSFVFSVSGPNQGRDVAIRNLMMGDADVGISSVGNINLDVTNVLLTNNDGGGLYMISGDQSVTLLDVSITGNDGPGILCTGANNVLNVRGDSVISNNMAANNGGGLLINAGCKANLFAPTQVTGNSAENHGGGVYVAGDSLVNLNGAVISGNTADNDGDEIGNGGGLYVSDSLSIVNAVNTSFEGNTAYSGGAVAAENEGRFTSYAENTQLNPCTSPGECSNYTGNSAQVRGGVLHAATEGQIKVLHANIQGNGLLDQGLVAHAVSDALVEIEGSMIVKNGGEDLPGNSLFFVNAISGDNLAAIKLNHVTIADNHVSESVVRNFFGTFSMNASIVIDDVIVSTAVAPVSHSFECVIAHETDSFSAGGTVTVDDPEFNSSNFDYHLKPTSPAIDYCYDAEPLTVELGYDIDLETRNYDDPNVTDLHGTYDIGADEYRWDLDLIFMNGFEQQ